MDNPSSIPTLNPGEKSASIMLYTQSSIIVADVHVVNQIRVSTWLKTNSAPDVIRLFNARVVITTGANPSRPITFSELHIPTAEVLAMHLLPPATEPLDYDSTEPNRHLLPVTILFSSFKIDGSLWASTRVDLAKIIELNREAFTSVYDVQISSPIFTSLPVMRLPMMICREEKVFFGARTTPPAP